MFWSHGFCEQKKVHGLPRTEKNNKKAVCAHPARDRRDGLRPACAADDLVLLQGERGVSGSDDVGVPGSDRHGLLHPAVLVHHELFDPDPARRQARPAARDLYVPDGHADRQSGAVYSLSDPREKVFKSFVEKLAKAKVRDEDMTLYNNIEEMAPKVIAGERKIFKGVSPNVDFYSGFVYDMLDIPRELYTPLFAVARISGWSAHRMEELITDSKIIRPAYKSLVVKRDYVSRDER